MADDQQLNELRQRVVGNLSGISGQLADDASVGFDTLLMIARSTGQMSVLNKAFERANAFESPADRAGAYLDLLDEIDYLAGRSAEQAAQDAAAAPAQPEQSDQPAEQPQQ